MAGRVSSQRRQCADHREIQQSRRRESEGNEDPRDSMVQSTGSSGDVCIQELTLKLENYSDEMQRKKKALDNDVTDTISAQVRCGVHRAGCYYKGWLVSGFRLSWTI